jgi:FAD binding domain
MRGGRVRRDDPAPGPIGSAWFSTVFVAFFIVTGIPNARLGSLEKECVMDPEQIPVLIVGAGGGGLSLSLLLLQQGIRPLLVERRTDISWYPRARNLNFRTMEVFRGLGLSDRIHAAGARVSRIFSRERLASSNKRR